MKEKKIFPLVWKYKVQKSQVFLFLQIIAFSFTNSFFFFFFFNYINFSLCNFKSPSWKSSKYNLGLFRVNFCLFQLKKYSKIIITSNKGYNTHSYSYLYPYFVEDSCTFVFGVNILTIFLTAALEEREREDNIIF